MRLDLHCHSTASDGALTPTQLVERALERGCRLLSLTDHDCLDGTAEAAARAAQLNLPFFAGVEISVSWRKHTVHIVGLNIDVNNSLLIKGLSQIRQGRVLRAKQMAAELERRLGVKHVFEGAMQFCANPEMIGRTHFARFLVHSGVCKNNAAVFKRYLTEGKVGFVKHEWASLSEALSWILSSGGVAVLAHPARYKMGKSILNQLLDEFMALGGEAIEVISGSHGEEDVRAFTRLARDRSLLASAGSDFHALGEGGRDVGIFAEFAEGLTPVWTKFYP